MDGVKTFEEILGILTSLKKTLLKETNIISSISDKEEVVNSASNIRKSLNLLNAIDKKMVLEIKNYSDSLEDYHSLNYNIHYYKDENCDIRMDKVESGWLLHFNYKINGEDLYAINKVFDSSHECLVTYVSLYSNVKDNNIKEYLNNKLT